MNRPHPTGRPPREVAANAGLAEQEAWLAQAERDARAFLMKQGHLLSDPSLVHWVVAQCAELVWERSRGRPRWATLEVATIWARLEELHDFFPLPRLIVAYCETLTGFLPWLLARAQIERGACAEQLKELERVCSPTLSEARRRLSARAQCKR